MVLDEYVNVEILSSYKLLQLLDRPLSFTTNWKIVFNNIHLKIFVVNGVYPWNRRIMYKISPAYVPVIGRYLHVYFFVRIEGERPKFHHFTGSLSWFYLPYKRNSPGLNWKT